jgi:hypothetical protein
MAHDHRLADRTIAEVLVGFQKGLAVVHGDSNMRNRRIKCPVQQIYTRELGDFSRRAVDWIC